MPDIKLIRAKTEHKKYSESISNLIAEAAQHKDSGLALRTPDFISEKIDQGKAIIALDGEVIAGFIYIEAWQNDKFVSHSGLIVNPTYRGCGLAKQLKEAAFLLSRDKFPMAKMFGLTTSLAVMKINSDLNYKPVTYSEITTDDNFWKGCESCQNFDILTRMKRVNCICTAMLWDPAKDEKKR